MNLTENKSQEKYSKNQFISSYGSNVVQLDCEEFSCVFNFSEAQKSEIFSYYLSGNLNPSFLWLSLDNTKRDEERIKNNAIQKFNATFKWSFEPSTKETFLVAWSFVIIFVLICVIAYSLMFRRKYIMVLKQTAAFKKK